jgi:hypothetical protein
MARRGTGVDAPTPVSLLSGTAERLGADRGDR